MATSHPFPTLWPAKDGVSGLVELLPSKDEIIDSLEIFHHRVQSCSFPHVPEECTKKEVERFLTNSQHNAHVHPDMLALLFATLAQCSQNGVYDRSGGKWVAGAMEAESKKGDVYSEKVQSQHLHILANLASRCCHASFADGVIHEQTVVTGSRNADFDWSISHQQRQVPRCMGVVRCYSQVGTKYWMYVITRG